MALDKVRSSVQFTFWLRTWPKTETVGGRDCMFAMACCWPATKAACALALAFALVVQLEVAISNIKKHPKSFCIKRFNLDSLRFATVRAAGQCPNLKKERWSVTRSRLICRTTCCGSQSRAPEIRTLPAAGESSFQRPGLVDCCWDIDEHNYNPT